MDIESRQEGTRRIVAVAGRLDGSWADHLTRRLDAEVREGHHDLVVDLHAVQYISSAGVRVLLTTHRQLRQLDGRFAVRRPSAGVRRVLELIGLTALVAVDDGGDGAESAPGATSAPPAVVREHVVNATRFEVHELGADTMRARLLGRPQRLADCSFEAADSTSLSLPEDTVALGVGAFGTGFDDCRELYGDFLAAAGGAVVRPGAIGMRCDHLLAEGAYVPEVQVLYGLACAGAFSRLLRFEPLEDARGANGEARETLGLGALVEQARAAADAPAVCLLLVAESAGLIGAELRRSPAALGAAGTRPAQFPQVRDWLSLSVERLDAGATVVALGVVADPASVPERARAFLRPLQRGLPWHAHLHAAPFRHRPLPRGRIEPARVLRPLFDGGSASTVLHLLSDDRDPSRVEESRFVRGACWVAPLAFEEVE